MSKNLQFNTVLPVDLGADGERQFLDVRKPQARLNSGLTIPGAVWRHPFDAANWADEFEDGQVAIFCVHGHEVSKAVGGYLADKGIDVVLIEGGFESWREAGLPVVALENGDE